MAEEKKEVHPAPGPFYAGNEKIDLRSEVVKHDQYGLPHWVGNQEVGRNAKSEAISLGGRELGRNSSTGAIENLDGKPLGWKAAADLQKFLDGK